MNAKLVILSQRERHVDPQFNMHVTSHCLYIVRGGERFTMNMASRSGKGKTCAAGGPGKVSCTNNSYTHGCFYARFSQKYANTGSVDNVC